MLRLSYRPSGIDRPDRNSGSGTMSMNRVPPGSTNAINRGNALASPHSGARTLLLLMTHRCLAPVVAAAESLDRAWPLADAAT